MIGGGVGRGIVAWVGLATVLCVAACGSSHSVPANPTWADVEPILRGECLSCHGGSAATTGSVGTRQYRFDFFELTAESCGEAASAVVAMPFASGWSQAIADSITSIDPTVRPRMPPAPALPLAEWEWQTILGWTGTHEKGPPPIGNRPPVVHLAETALTVDKRLVISVVLDDPDGQSAVGVLSVGDFKLKMDRPGAFSVTVDTSEWDDGDLSVQATVCDGWGNASYALGTVTVLHTF